MAISKPDLTRVWANGAPSGNVVDPDTTTAGKFSAGWVAEVPPFEHFNFLQKLFTESAAYNNEQGVNEWDSNTTYPVNALTKGSDGNLYIAILEQSNNNPVNDEGVNWLLYIGKTNFANLDNAKSYNLLAGLTVKTYSYYEPSPPAVNKGGAEYLVLTAAQYAGTPDGWGDHELDNGNVLKLISNNGSISIDCFGVVSNGVFNADYTAAMTAAENSEYTVIFTPGTYAQHDFSVSDQNITMGENVIFKLPDNTVTAPATTGPAVMLLSGSNITINGDFTIDGNKGNNDASNFASDARQGAFEVAGNNIKINGNINIVDSYFVGATLGDSITASSEIQNLYIERIEISNSFAQSLLAWAMENWQIDAIKVRRSATPGVGRDNRIRFGTSSSASSFCRHGSLGPIDTDDTVVWESKTVDVTFTTIHCAGIKFEDNDNIRGGAVICDGDLLGAIAQSFGYNGSNNIHVESVLVLDHNGLTDATVFTGLMTNCSVGSLRVEGTVSNQTDCLIRTVDGLSIGSVSLTSPVSTNNRGLHFDNDGSTHNNVNIGRVISTGHTLEDVLWEGGFTSLSIGSINKDADFGLVGRRALSFPYGVECAALFTVAATIPTLNSNVSYNVASITYNGSPGSYTINTNGAVVGDFFEIYAAVGTGGLDVQVQLLSTTSIRLIIRNSTTGAGADPDTVKFISRAGT